MYYKVNDININFVSTRDSKKSLLLKKYKIIIKTNYQI